MSALTDTATASALEASVIEALQQVYDPEIPVNIYDLGLIYELHVMPDQSVYVRMTLTTPHCPAAGTLPGEVEMRIRDLPAVTDVRVELTFTPPYHRDMMSDEAKLILGFL